jgi:hypothetical protein
MELNLPHNQLESEYLNQMIIPQVQLNWKLNPNKSNDNPSGSAELEVLASLGCG